MKLDWYTKIILTGICVCLGMLVLGRGVGMNEAKGQAPAANVLANVEVVPYPQGFILFDKATGEFCAYDIKSEKGFPFEKFTRTGRIAKLGAEVEQLP